MQDIPARDHWIENLSCRLCQKTGSAALSSPDALSWEARVDSVSDGFKAEQFEHGSMFFCSTCESPVAPSRFPVHDARRAGWAERGDTDLANRG